MSGDAPIGTIPFPSANIVPFGRDRPKADVRAVNQMQPVKQTTPVRSAAPAISPSLDMADELEAMDTVAVAELLRVLPLHFINLCHTLTSRRADGAEDLIREAKSAMRAMIGRDEAE